MDKETLSNYGWITICVLVLAVMIALATPFGEFVGKGFKATYEGLSDTTNNALGVVRLGDIVGGGNDEQETYEITNSPDAPVTTSTALTFTSNADFSKFVRVEIDGETVSSDNYTAVSGSTIITLDGEYVATLENGTHTLTIVSTDGEASCEFEITISNEQEQPDEPETSSGPTIEFSNGATYIVNSTITQISDNTYRVLINTNSVELKSVGIKTSAFQAEITSGTWLVSGTIIASYNPTKDAGSCAYSNATTLSGNIFQIDLTADSLAFMDVEVIAKNGSTTLYDETATIVIPPSAAAGPAVGPGSGPSLGF